MNAKTAHSQLMGGIVWGLSMALFEESLLDVRDGRFVNANLAEYHVPVNADIGDIEDVTGHGLKTIEAASPKAAPDVTIEATMEAFNDALGSELVEHRS